MILSLTIISCSTNINHLILYFPKIYGKEFETVTLRSLGLGSGKALFRLLQRDPERLMEQAHVYNIPQKPKIPKTEDSEDSKPRGTAVVNPSKTNILDPVSVTKAESQRVESPNEVKEEKETEIKNDNEIPTKVEKKEIEKEEETPMEVDTNNGPLAQQSSMQEFEEVPQVEFVSTFCLVKFIYYKLLFEK